MSRGAIANLHAALSWDLSDFDQGTAHIGGVFGKLRTMAVHLANSITSTFKGMTLGITAPFTALSLFAVKAASDATELQGAFDHVFQNLSKGMNDWAEETGNALGRSTQTMQESARQFQMLFTKALDPAAAAEMSKTFSVLAEDVDSFYNLATGEGRTKLFSGLTGESEPLKSLGVFINETAVKAKAMELGLSGANIALTEQEKIMVRAILIREQLTAADGDVIRTSSDLANSWRALLEIVHELRVEFGARLEPVANRLVAWAQRLLEKIQALPDWVKDLSVKFAVLVAAMGPVMLVMSTLAIVLLPLFLARLNPIFLALSALLNPIGTAVVFLWRLAGGFSGIGAALSGLMGGGGLALLRTLFLRLTGPIGLAITAILLFKDNILSAFSAVREYAGGSVGAAFSRFFATLGDLIGSVSEKLDKLAKSPVGQFFEAMIDGIGKLVEKLLVLLGIVTVEVLVGILKALTAMTEGVIRFVDMVDALFSGEWLKAWQVATDGTGNAVNAMINIIKGMFPFLYLAIELIERISGKSLAGGAKMPDFVKPFEYKKDSADPSEGYTVSGIPKTAGAGRKGRSGPSAAELEARRTELRLQHELDVAREGGDRAAERRLQRELDMLRKIDQYTRAGLSTAQAKAATERDFVELDAVRLRVQEENLALKEDEFDLELARIRGDHAAISAAEDRLFLQERTNELLDEEVELADARRLAELDLAAISQARAEQAARRRADEEATHQIELARIRGDNWDSIRAMEERQRMADRAAQLEAQDRMSPEDAWAQAMKEGADRNRAHLQGTFRDTFRDGLQAALDGRLGDFFQNWLREKSFNALSQVLDRLADALANLVSGGGGGGGIFGVVLGGIGAALGGGGGLNFLGGNTASAMGAKSLSGLQAGFVPAFDSGGSFRISGFKGVDKNLLSLNGNPIARVSHGEIMNIKRGDQAGGARGGVNVSMPINIDATGADPAALARTNQKIDQLRAELPGRVVAAVTDAQSRFVIPGGR